MDLVIPLILTLCVASTQDPGTKPGTGPIREPAFGVARKPDQSPWIGARIRLVSQPFPGCQDRDVIEAVTDEQGRFRAATLPGRVYSAWASVLDGEAWRVSTVVDDIVPNLPIVFEATGTEPCVSVRLSGLLPWATPGPVTLWCAGSSDAACALPIPVQEGQQVDLPPTGTGERWLFLTAGNGLDLFRRKVRADERGTIDIAVPHPLEVPVHVLAPDRTPVAGARVFVRSPVGAHLPGQTDRDGRVVVKVPGPGSDTDRQPSFLPLWAEAPGHLCGRLWNSTADPAGPWTIFVQPSPPRRCQLLWADGQPIANAPLWISGVEQSIEPERSRDGTLIGHPNGQFATDGYRRTGTSGEVELAYDPAFAISIGVLLPSSRLEQLTRQFGGAVSPLVLIWAGDLSPDSDPVARVDNLRAVRLRFRNHDGSPAQRAQMQLGAGESPGLGLRYVADNAGAVTLLLPVSENIMVAAWCGAQGGVYKLAVPAGKAALTEIELRFHAPAILRGTVRDANGVPVPGARVSLGASLRGPRGQWVSIENKSEPATPRLVAEGYFYPAMALPMFRRTVVTDTNGGYQFGLPSLDFPLSITVDGRLRRDAADFPQLDARLAEIDLVLR